jgi:hypothetical protein
MREADSKISEPQYVDFARTLIATRESQLGRKLSDSEKIWLVKGAFVFKLGKRLGTEKATAALGELRQRELIEETTDIRKVPEE